MQRYGVVVWCGSGVVVVAFNALGTDMQILRASSIPLLTSGCGLNTSLVALALFRENGAATTVNGAHSKPEGSGFVCYAVRAADCIALQHYKTSINLIASPTKPINTLMVDVLLDVLYFSSSSLHRLLLLLVGAVEFASLLSLSLSLSLCLSVCLSR
jgi:hypothetical protein